MRLCNFPLLFSGNSEKLCKWKVKFMEKRFKLKVEDVLNKQFNIDFKGYSSVEVDEFLDLVINDYQEYDAMIEKRCCKWQCGYSEASDPAGKRGICQ